MKKWILLFGVELLLSIVLPCFAFSAPNNPNGDLRCYEVKADARYWDVQRTRLFSRQIHRSMADASGLESFAILEAQPYAYLYNNKELRYYIGWELGCVAHRNPELKDGIHLTDTAKVVIPMGSKISVYLKDSSEIILSSFKESFYDGFIADDEFLWLYGPQRIVSLTEISNQDVSRIIQQGIASVVIQTREGKINCFVTESGSEKFHRRLQVLCQEMIRMSSISKSAYIPPRENMDGADSNRSALNKFCRIVLGIVAIICFVPIMIFVLLGLSLVVMIFAGLFKDMSLKYWLIGIIWFSISFIIFSLICGFDFAFLTKHQKVSCITEYVNSMGKKEIRTSPIVLKLKHDIMPRSTPHPSGKHRKEERLSITPIVQLTNNGKNRQYGLRIERTCWELFRWYEKEDCQAIPWGEKMVIFTQSNGVKHAYQAFATDDCQTQQTSTTNWYMSVTYSIDEATFHRLEQERIISLKIAYPKKDSKEKTDVKKVRINRVYGKDIRDAFSLVANEID